MMRLLLHGPATNSSRRSLQEIKKKFDPDNIVVFEKGEDPGIILTNLQSVSLFEGERLVVIENPPEGVTFDASDSSDTVTLLLWFDHEVDTKKRPGFKVLFFPEGKETSVFAFLDLLAAKDKRAFLEIEKLKKADFDIFYFLTMTYYLLRSLTATPKAAKQFVRDKLQRQRKNFSPEKITSLYKEVLEIEFKLKSGLLEKPQAEFLLINKFLE